MLFISGYTIAIITAFFNQIHLFFYHFQKNFTSYPVFAMKIKNRLNIQPVFYLILPLFFAGFAKPEICA
jgi:hypothetical protein